MSGHALALLTKRRDELLTRQTVREYLEITEAIEQMQQQPDQSQPTPLTTVSGVGSITTEENDAA
jgi:hypothetical protein